MNEITTASLKSQIPTLALISSFLGVGAYLIKGSQLLSLSGILGSIILIIGIFLGLFLFFDKFNKEHIDWIVRNYKDAIERLSGTLTSTHGLIDGSNQSSLNKLNRDIGGEKRSYSYDTESGTLAK